MRARHGNHASATSQVSQRARRSALLGGALMAALIGCSSAQTPATTPAGQPGSASPAATPDTPGATAGATPATVEKRLADLTKQGIKVERTAGADCAFESKQAATVARLCETMASQQEGPASCDPGASRLENALDHEIDIDDKALTSAALFSMYVEENFSDLVYIALRYRGAWHVSPLATVYNPGAFGIFEDLEITRFESDQLIPGGSPEVVVRFIKHRRDTDMGIDEEEGSTHAVVAVFGVMGGKVSHLMAIEEDFSYLRDRLGLMDEESETEAGGDGAAGHTRDLPIERKRGVSVRFVPARGSVVIEARQDLEPSHEPGTYSLQTFPVRCLPGFVL